jgi:opacity protein-like surface antigen
MRFSTRKSGLNAICFAAELAAALSFCAAHAQVAPSATRSVHTLSVGGEYSNIEAGFPYNSSQRLDGFGVFVDYSLTGNLGIEADARFLRFNSFYGETEDNYLAGPRYRFLRFGRLQPMARCLFGVGKMHYPFAIGSDSYFAIAPAAGASYRIGRRLSLRAEYEYQFWPGSPDITNEPAHEITPNGIHVGIAYQLFR